ncbi:hypothetical protein DM02DRAFT_704116 [Periconia macrospinosa]|uniref:Uncharacterized protein n=1 Tax=Periconia macrospinosa TaxID=97972 RepID=A0A2V1D0R2_9PLEO|nr:hypothetical protein DM02DRAFT_704116 [Periconia macrospinosa]
MLASLWSFFASERELPPTPPSVKIIGVRIPADGSPAHLLSLTTIGDSRAADGFLFHVPDLRAYWNTELSWRYRDILRLDLLEHDDIPRSHHLRQRHDLKNLLLSQPKSHEQLFRLRQRYLLDQQYHVLPQQYLSCTGTYYVYYSYNQDALPKNQFVPAWICDNGDGLHQHHGDVFLVKMAPHEYEYDNGGHGQNRWAAYEDILPLFLDLLAEGPGHQKRKVYHF